MKFFSAAAVAATLLVAACSQEQPALEPAEEAQAADPGDALHALFDEYFERGLELNPVRASAIGDYGYDDLLPRRARAWPRAGSSRPTPTPDAF